MVLQQLSDVSIWGHGIPGKSVKINSNWGESSTTIVSQSGNWMTTLKTPVYGGPYEIKVKSETDEIKFKDVLIGEVWLASGQSNMEWPMSARIINQKQEIQNANYPNIRMFSVPRNLNGINIDLASWKVSTLKNISDFSAVGYFFAREIHNRLGVPVGIINSSWGGTRVEAWTSIEKLAEINSSKKEAQEIILKGGVKGITAKKALLNKKIILSNEAYFNTRSYSIPDSFKGWKNLDLEDLEYSKVDFDDKDWDELEVSGSDEDLITFERIFKKETYAEDGVIWLRKKFDISNTDTSYRFIAQGGIDDFDYTYINGKLIGKGMSCCEGRSYDIPPGILKEKDNILAIRVLDLGEVGGFRSSIYLESNKDRFEFDKGIWRFKHIAFYLNSSIQKHNLSSQQLINDEKVLKTKIKKGLTIEDPNMYSILYNTMIKPLVPYTLKGFLWYQGESNVNNYYQYKNLFTGMISDWREKWKQDLPFYFVQIAPFIYSDIANGCGTCLSHELRDAQRKSLDLIKTGMVVTSDIAEKNDIHPANKQDVGKRLARLALSNDYEKTEFLSSGPLYVDQKNFKSYIDLYFDHKGTGLMAKGKLKDFEIASEDQNFHPAYATIIEDKVRVSSKKVVNPKFVRYGWKNYFEASLFNKEGLPVSSFRTP
ncbi:MAG: sialate O-acetylesterase [Flavobacteriaceae bacterium]|nr:sialate O-acetylesterase [Flavobacteriaceae bacterium]